MKVWLQINRDGTSSCTYQEADNGYDGELVTNTLPSMQIFTLLGWLFDKTVYNDGKATHIY